VQREAQAIIMSGGFRDLYDEWTVGLVSSGDPPYGMILRLRAVRLLTETVVAPGAWTHLLICDEGGMMRVYLNGQLLAERNLGEPLLGRGEHGFLRLGGGALDGAPFSPFVGEVPGLRVYRRALSPAEATAEHAAGPFGR
jgi:hypothetical protein